MAKAKTEGAIFLSTHGIDICSDDVLESFGLRPKKLVVDAKDWEQKALKPIVGREVKGYHVKDVKTLICWKLGFGIPGLIKGLKVWKKNEMSYKGNQNQNMKTWQIIGASGRQM